MTTNLLVKKALRKPEIEAEVSNMPLSNMAKIVLSNRASKYSLDPAFLLDFKLSELDNPIGLPDIDIAAKRIADAIYAGEIIALETDHDADGCTSHAVLYSALTDYFGVPRENVLQYIGHRLHEGYGLSDALCDRILSAEKRPSLIITADNGSSDGPRITRMKNEGIDVIVTDHHAMPVEGHPKDAFACVTPTRKDSKYPDPLIAGVMVAWLTMSQVRIELVSRGMTIPSLKNLLDYVSVGTVADCVSMAQSKNNRIVIRHGLKMINARTRPCWDAYLNMLVPEGKEATATDSAFLISPRINASGRIDDAMVSVHFMLSTSYEEATMWLGLMSDNNDERKDIEKNLKEEALQQAIHQVAGDKNTVQILLEVGHAGVHGIVASRLVEMYGRPTVCFSKKEGEDDLLTASARSIDGIHIRDMLQILDDSFPGILVKWGGHAGAAGLTIKKDSFNRFKAAFEAIVSAHINSAETPIHIGPVLHIDELIPADMITEQEVEGLDVIEPFGREFERPVFATDIILVKHQIIGKAGNTLRLDFSTGTPGNVISGIWFGVQLTEVEALKEGQYHRVIFSPDFNWWRGSKKLQLVVKKMKPL